MDRALIWIVQHLYCYVDESGQDPTAHDGRRRIFIVAVALFESNRDELEKLMYSV